MSYRATGFHQSKAKSFLVPMIRFHNRIKQNVYCEITKKSKDNFSIIEIGAGYLNDLNRIITAGITEVYAIEPDKKSIKKGNELLKKSQKTPPKVNWINSTLQKLYQDDSELKDVKVDAIFSMFSGGYLFSDKKSYEQFAEFISKHTNGYFVIVYYDSDAVRSFFQKKRNKQLIYKKDNTILLRVSFDNDSLKVLIGSIGKEHNERLIDYDLLTKCLNEKGFILYEKIPFKTFRTGILNWKFPNLTLQNYSDLHVVTIWKYNI